MATIRVSDGQAWHSGSITKATDKIYGVVKFATEDEVLNGVGEDKAVNATTINNVVENITDSIEELSDETVKLDGDQDINGIKTFNDNITAPNQIDYSRITNCITEIPQDIKLELVDGVLTLKADSKVYVPNGFEADGTTPKFDVVVIESDKSYNFDISSPWEFFLLDKNSIDRREHDKCFSGPSEPDSTNTVIVWYDTTNNIVKKINNGSVVGYMSLPISLLSTNTSIDQTFNGFGYIGSTVFALPGVKGLIPNGRNEDGSLKNIELTTNSVLTRTISGVSSFYEFAIATTGIGINDHVLNESENYLYNAQGTRLEDRYVSGKITFSQTAPYNVTSYQPKRVFCSVDNQDVVHNYGDEIVDGVKTFLNAPFIETTVVDSRITTKNKSFKIGETVSANSFSGFKGVDADGTEYANCNCSYNTSGRVGCNFYVKRSDSGTLVEGSLGIYIDKNGTSAYTIAPTPSVGDSSTKIATTAWFNQKIQVVSTLPASPDSNVYYFVTG